MVYRGHIQNGTVVVDDRAELPDGAEVEIRVLPKAEAPIDSGDRPWLHFSGSVDDLPANASQQIDQTLYGSPEE